MTADCNCYVATSTTRQNRALKRRPKLLAVSRCSGPYPTHLREPCSTATGLRVAIPSTITTTITAPSFQMFKSNKVRRQRKPMQLLQPREHTKHASIYSSLEDFRRRLLGSSPSWRGLRSQCQSCRGHCAPIYGTYISRFLMRRSR